MLTLFSRKAADRNLIKWYFLRFILILSGYSPCRRTGHHHGHIFQFNSRALNTPRLCITHFLRTQNVGLWLGKMAVVCLCSRVTKRGHGRPKETHVLLPGIPFTAQKSCELMKQTVEHLLTWLLPKVLFLKFSVWNERGNKKCRRYWSFDSFRTFAPIDLFCSSLATTNEKVGQMRRSRGSRKFLLEWKFLI